VGGGVHTVNAIKTPVKDSEGNVTHLIGITRDITDRKRLEVMKDRFIAAATGEIRTPLVSIKGYADYVLSGKSGTISPAVESNLSVVKRNTDLLLQITDDLSDMRLIESGKLQLHIESLDFKDVMRNCIEGVQPFIANRKQDLHVESPDEPLPVRGDRSRLSQVVLNLLTNASKFTPEGERISLLAKGNTDSIEVQVSDTGIGIKNEDLERIWEPFTTVEKPSHIKGTGLGLSVAKGLIELHHGKIWVESPGEGKGATFKITIPRIEVVEVAQ
jgi:two-component system sensor histidine kinase VicK